MFQECSDIDLKDIVLKLIPEAISQEIQKACQSIFPLQNVYIRKVKVLKKPKFDLVKLMEVHAGGEDTGVAIDREEPPAVESLGWTGGRL